MIKIFCNECGKEIVDNPHTVATTTDIKDNHGATLLVLRGKTLHYCDECHHKKLTCGFKVGDQVITDDGRVGIITDFCECENCKKRGFYEPTIKMIIGNGSIRITDRDKELGFTSFYQVGGRVFGNVNKQSVIDAIEYKKEEITNNEIELINLKSQLNMIKKLNKGN